MAILARANEKQQSEWRPVFEGLWRWNVGKPELKMDERFGKYRVIIPLQLLVEEQKRMIEQHGEPEEGTTQSWRVQYRPNLSLGWINSKTGQYESTMLIDFLCATLGTENGKKFRKWVEQGGGPPRPEDKDDQAAELSLIDTWLSWWEDLEVYGTITHSVDKQGRTWANFAGPMPVGSLPGQPEPDYQALCRGKLRAMMAESRGEEVSEVQETAAAIKEEVAKARQTIAKPTEDDEDAPF